MFTEPVAGSSSASKSPAATESLASTTDPQTVPNRTDLPAGSPPGSVAIRTRRLTRCWWSRTGFVLDGA